jgi:hypothetical protein
MELMFPMLLILRLPGEPFDPMNGGEVFSQFSGQVVLPVPP